MPAVNTSSCISSKDGTNQIYRTTGPSPLSLQLYPPKTFGLFIQTASRKRKARKCNCMSLHTTCLEKFYKDNFCCFYFFPT